jgi:hypothetical protein
LKSNKVKRGNSPVPDAPDHRGRIWIPGNAASLFFPLVILKQIVQSNNRNVSAMLNHPGKSRSIHKKIFWGILILLVLLYCGYWLKCRLGINFFESISISSHLPFNNLFNNRILEVTGPGVVLFEDFEHFKLSEQWSNSILMHNSKAVRQLVEGASDDHSTCLQISATGKGHWSYPFEEIIQVNKGDIFYFEGLVNIEKGSAAAGLRVASLNKNRKVIDWDLAARRVKKSGRWVKADKQFTIMDSRIRYITFRLTGGGGVYRFDNLILRRLN